MAIVRGEEKRITVKRQNEKVKTGKDWNETRRGKTRRQKTRRGDEKRGEETR